MIDDLVVINNEYLASCSLDKTIKLWSLDTYNEVNSWTASNDRCYALAFDPKLNVLVSAGGDDNEIRVWDSRLWTNITKDNQGKRFKTKHSIIVIYSKLVFFFFKRIC